MEEGGGGVGGRGGKNKQTKTLDSKTESCQISCYSLGSHSTEARTKRTRRAMLAN